MWFSAELTLQYARGTRDEKTVPDLALDRRTQHLPYGTGRKDLRPGRDRHRDQARPDHALRRTGPRRWAPPARLCSPISRWSTQAAIHDQERDAKVDVDPMVPIPLKSIKTVSILFPAECPFTPATTIIDLAAFSRADRETSSGVSSYTCHAKLENSCERSSLKHS